MPSQINHVSVNTRNLEESVEFYVDLLGVELLPTPNFGIPVQWLALGGTQLHLFERDIQPTSHHHLGITVDDVEPVYRAAQRRNAFDYPPGTTGALAGAQLMRHGHGIKPRAPAHAGSLRP